MMNKPLFEVCLQSPADAIAAQRGGADRVELCAALVEGGITPSAASIQQCIDAVDLGVMVMVRPRGGDFYYDDLEYAQMEASIDHCRTAGAMGVVFGMLKTDGSLALPQVKSLVERAGELEVTFHRAFDVCRDPFLALEQLIDAGVHRILTSGQRGTVPEGADLIKRLIERAKDRVIIMPGCGIDAGNVRDVLDYTGASEFHATAFRRLVSPMIHRNPEVYMGLPGLPEYEREITCEEVVRQLVTAAAPHQ